MPVLDHQKIDYIPSYIAALREGFRIGIGKPKTAEEIDALANNPLKILDSFLLPKTGPVTLPTGEIVERIQQTDLWLVEGNEFIGQIGIRHTLLERTMIFGGNMGYGVRPSEQNKGHATTMIKLGLEFCRDTLGLQKVLITVNDDNIPSIRAIEKNGGVLEDKRPSPIDNALIRRYWITL